MQATDEDYVRLAYGWASRSGDLSTQNGAILVRPGTGEIVAAGWNDIHGPMEDRQERRVRPAKYEWTEHAERTAILDAARRGVATEGLTMYCPWFACADCGRAIILAGIKRVVGHKIPQHDTRPDWAASIATAAQMFKEAGVETAYLTEKLGVTFRFCGEIIEV